MIYTLYTPEITVTVDSFGAELKSIRTNSDKQEFLWQYEGTSFWQRQAPVLFPIVGQLKGDTYSLNGNTYQMSKHGFARDMEFKCYFQSFEEIKFVLRSDEETMKYYPYDFSFHIIYKLEKNKIQVRYIVENQCEERMFFSVGGHPAFRCPIAEGETLEDYFLEFETPEHTARHFLENGLYNNETMPILFNTNRLPLSERLFQNDAIVLKYINSKAVTLKCDKHGEYVKIDFADFPYLGVWKQPEAPFICIEPWLGLADSTYTDGNFAEKEGIQALGAYERMNVCFSIEIGKIE
ncbi:MAG: aldose 1-epimerase family protein [Bacteroidia bacterium]